MGTGRLSLTVSIYTAIAPLRCPDGLPRSRAFSESVLPLSQRQGESTVVTSVDSRLGGVSLIGGEMPLKRYKPRESGQDRLLALRAELLK